MGKSKAELRKEMVALRADLTFDNIKAASTKIEALLSNWELWQKATRVLVFAASPDEPNIDSVLAKGMAQGKLVFFPFVSKIKIGRAINFKQLEVVKPGYRQPTSDIHKSKWPEFDLVLMPGVAFDAKGNRLGQGSGWYDRFFGEYLKIFRNPKTVVAGVSFAVQVVEQVPVERHDIPCHYVVTETGIVKIPTSL